MIAYGYNPDTKEYAGEIECQPNPLEGGYLLPGNSTFKKPPIIKEKQIAVWNDKWEIKDDYRDEVFWDKTTKEKIEITEIGIAKDDNWTELEPISNRCIWKIDKWIDIPLTAEELVAIKEAQDQADYIQAMPNLVKSLEARIAVLESTKKE